MIYIPYTSKIYQVFWRWLALSPIKMINSSNNNKNNAEIKTGVLTDWIK